MKLPTALNGNHVNYNSDVPFSDSFTLIFFFLTSVIAVSVPRLVYRLTLVQTSPALWRTVQSAQTAQQQREFITRVMWENEWFLWKETLKTVKFHQWHIVW